MTKAKKDVLLKWDFFKGLYYKLVSDYNHAYTLLHDEYPRLAAYSSSCAYCNKYNHPERECAGCPVVAIGEPFCYSDSSKYMKWQKNPCKRTANAMYKMLLKT